MPPAIEVRGLTKVFYPARPFGAWLRAPWRRGEPIRALEDISLTVNAGEVFCLMGSNGAGKTTLLKILTGLLLPTSGTVLINGQDVARISARLRSQVGFASSDRPGFYDQLTGRQNLAFFAALYGLSTRQAARRIAELTELLEIAAPDQPYQACSAGMKQRLLLARALLHDPPIVLLDEPAKSLDPLRAETLRALLHDRFARSGKTVLLTTHSAAEAEACTGRIAVLQRGGLKACGTVRDISAGDTLHAALKRLCES
ncbi:MAG: ABC transporter ATP-binding protein [Candidatus Omnitrophica bacterium]|nr:ABC transporter ATP-binding protein [Candidatus Omnitrophota bacterium]